MNIWRKLDKINLEMWQRLWHHHLNLHILNDVFAKCFVKISETSEFHNFGIICPIFIKCLPFCSYISSLFIEINLNLDLSLAFKWWKRPGCCCMKLTINSDFAINGNYKYHDNKDTQPISRNNPWKWLLIGT